MRKRSKYRPKPVLTNNVAYVLAGMLPMNVAKTAMVELFAKNHYALTSLAKGQGSAADITMLSNAFIVAQALRELGMGIDLDAELDAAQEALLALAQRAKETGSFTVRGPELTALNLGMEVCDAQLDVCTISELEQATEAASKSVRKALI